MDNDHILGPNEPDSASAKAKPIEPADAPVATARRPRRRLAIAAAVVAALGVGGVVGAKTYARPGPPFFGPPHADFMRMDPATMAYVADKGVRHIAIEIDATSEQQEKLRAIVAGLVKDLAPLRDTRQNTDTRLRTILSQDKVDRAALDALASEKTGQIDEAAKRVAQALGEASEILNAEQRRKLIDRLPPPPGAGPFWRRG